MTFSDPSKSFRSPLRRPSLGTCPNVTEAAVAESTGRRWSCSIPWSAPSRFRQHFAGDRKLKDEGVDVRLAHSRFRPAERRAWREEFLDREACGPGTNRIVVATQVVEAGVDISASLLVTELAPWPSLVQRFGRCARWGGAGQVVVADFGHDSDRKVAPYSLDELATSREACGKLRDVGPIHLERFEEENQEFLPCLYPYQPTHLLLRHELNELFDTSSDLSGADVDISRFIRSGDERDVQVFWAEVGGDDPLSSMKPTPDELCSVPFLKVSRLAMQAEVGEPEAGRSSVGLGLAGSRMAGGNPPRRLPRDRRCSSRAAPEDIAMIRAGTPASNEAVAPVRVDDEVEYVNRPCWMRDGDGWRPHERRVRRLPPEDHADAAEDDEALSVADVWQTIAGHGLQVGAEVARIAAEVRAEGSAAVAHSRTLARSRQGSRRLPGLHSGR